MDLAGLRERPASFLYHLFWNSLDWVFPPTCGGCGKPYERWCAGCQASVAQLRAPVCPRCGQPQAGSDLCPECAAHPPALAGLRSYARYEGAARNALLRLKYGRDVGLGEALAAGLVERLRENDWPVDMITCVPLSPARLRERGYNQSAMLARPLALAIGRPFQPVLLRKTREARSQVGLSASDRRSNVDGAFTAAGASVHSRAILVIDDITTTGSTLNACARALLAAGASAVYGLTFARAGLHDHTVPPPDSFHPGGNYGSLD